MAVESLRRRRFGTEVSSIWAIWCVGPSLHSNRRCRHEPHAFDGTSGMLLTGVTISNREAISTLGVTWLRRAHLPQMLGPTSPNGLSPPRSDTLGNR